MPILVLVTLSGPIGPFNVTGTDGGDLGEVVDERWATVFLTGGIAVVLMWWRRRRRRP
jgi:hypothetical protein